MMYIRILISVTVISCSLILNGQADTLSLSGAIQRTLENNYGIIISKADLEIATLNDNWGNAGRYPSIGFDASANYSVEPVSGYLSPSSRLSAGLGADWILFDGFRVNFTKAKLETLRELSSGRLAVIVESGIEEVILMYFNVRLQQERLEVLQKVMQLSSDRYDYEKRKQALGGSVTYNVLQAKNVFLNDKALLMNQQVVVRNAIRNLNFLMAEEASKTWDFVEPFKADTTEYILSDLLSKMTANNQTLKNQYTNLLLTQHETSLKEAGYYPSVSVSAGVDFSYFRSSVSGSAPSTSHSIAPYGNVRLNYDLYTGGVRRRAVDVARINEEIAAVEIDQMKHALTNELLNLYDFYRVRVALLDVADENLDAAELNLSISEEKYRSGVINSFNYRDIQLIYLSAALQRLQAVYDLIDSRTQLTRITGGFLDTQAP